MDRYQTGIFGMPAARSQGFEEFMALIEIPNVYTFDMATSAAGSKRFAVIGEPVVAVDLINTVAAPGSPTPGGLQAADRDVQAWRRIERTRVPGGDLADIWALRRLRPALQSRGRVLAELSAGVRDARGRKPTPLQVRDETP